MAQQSFGIELRAGVDVTEFRRELRAAQGDFNALIEVIDKYKRKAGDVKGTDVTLNFKGKDAASSVIKVQADQLGRLSDGYKELGRELNKIKGAEAGSVTALRQGLSYQKQQLSLTNKNSKEYAHLEQKVRGYQTALNKAQGIEVGSISALRQKASELKELSEAYALGSVQQRKFANELRKVQAQISGTNRTFSTFLGVLNKLATIQAGFTAFSAILQQFTSRINEITNQQKQLEGFELALKNIGLSSIEAAEALDDASRIANELGAPIQQVEKSFKRMLPALQSIGVEGKDASNFIEQITARTQTLGLNTDQSGRFLEAFAQVLSKGKLQGEELNQQLSELDGALRSQLADALGVATSELEEMVAAGKITAPVFVDAVLKMANGVDVLKALVASGNQTIQQLQNEISNLNTDNLRDIGAAFEPAIKAILRIQKLFAEFIRDFSQTQLGQLLIDVFNDLAEGTENFTKVFLATLDSFAKALTPVAELIRAFNNLLAPIGGVVGVLTTLALTFGTTKLALASFQTALKLKDGFSAFIANSGLAKTAVGGLANALGLINPDAFADSLSKAGGAVKITGDVLPDVSDSLGDVANNANKASKGFGAMAAEGLKAAGIGLGITLAVQVLSKAYEDATENSREFRDSLKETKQALSEQGVEVKQSKDLFSQFADSLWFSQVAKFTFAIKDAGDEMGDIKNAVKGTGDAFDKLGVNIMSVESVLKLTDDQLKENLDINKKLETSIKGRIKQLEGLIAIEEKNGRGLLPQNVLLKKNLEILKRSEKQISFNVIQLQKATDKRAGEKQKVEEQIDSLKRLNNERKQESDLLGTAKLKAQKAALDQYGDSIKNNTMLAAANFGIEEAFYEADKRNIQDKIARNQKLLQGEITDAKEKAKLEQQQIDLQKALAQAELNLANKRREFAQAAIDEFERVINKQSELAAKYQETGRSIISAVNKVRDSGKNALSTLGQLADQVFQRELKNLDPSSRKAKEIAEMQLRFQIKIGRMQDQIDRAKLDSTFRIAQIETKTLQARLRAEATIAQQRGDNEGASALNAQADAQNDILKLREQQYKLDLQSIDFNRRLREEKIMDQALEKGIADEYTNQITREKEISKRLGIRRTKLGELYQFYRGLGEILAENNEKEKKGQKEMEKGYEKQIDATDKAAASAERFRDAMREAKNSTEGIVKDLQTAVSTLSGGKEARWMGGPVQGGQTYRVNDAGLGREAFMNQFGNIKMLPAGSNINWTAPSSGTIIPAAIVKRLQRNADINSSISSTRQSASPVLSGPAASSMGGNSGNLVKQMTAAMSASGGNQRITNNVTIQSQQPVTDASQIMTNVARMRLRNARRI